MIGATIHHVKEMMYMRRFNFWLPEELFERIKLHSKFYNISITKIMVELLEIGYVEMLNTRKINNKVERFGDEYDN